MFDKIKNYYFKYLERRNSKRLLAFVGKLGSNHIFYRGSNISLLYGSSKNDILIGDRFWLSGILVSEFGGKITIGDYCMVQPNSVIGAVDSVTIGDYTSIASNVTIMDNNNHPVQPDDRKIKQHSVSGDILRSWKYAESKPIVIGENVWIGTNSRINSLSL